MTGTYNKEHLEVALKHREELILEVSCAPAMDELVWATRGGQTVNRDTRPVLAAVPPLHATLLAELKQS